MNNNEITSLFDDWNRAIKTGNPEKVVALYDENAILLPTISNQVRHNHDEMKDYFIQFLDRGPQGIINEANVRIFDNIAINSGIYTFTFNDGMSVEARFTFVYQLNDGQWKIIEHHSSQMPE